jgi:MYXO-CTERM domain-containing protein
MTVLLRNTLTTTLIVAAAWLLPGESRADPDANVCNFASCANVNTTCGQDPVTGQQTLTLAVALNNLSRSPASAARLTLAEVSGATVHSVAVASDPDGLDVDLANRTYSLGGANQNPPAFYRHGNFSPALAERTSASSPGNYTLVLAFRDLAGNPVSLRNVDVTNTAEQSLANRLPSLGLDSQNGVAAQQSLYGAPGYDDRGPLLYATTMQPIDPEMPVPDCMNTTTPTGQLTEEHLALGPWSIDGVSLVKIAYTPNPGADLAFTMNWELGEVVGDAFVGRPDDTMTFGSFFLSNGPNATLPLWVNNPTIAPSALSGFLPLSDGTCPQLGTASRVGVLQPVSTCETVEPRVPDPPLPGFPFPSDAVDFVKRICANQLAAKGLRPGDIDVDGDADALDGEQASGCTAAGSSSSSGALWALAALALFLRTQRRRARR